MKSEIQDPSKTQHIVYSLLFTFFQNALCYVGAGRKFPTNLTRKSPLHLSAHCHFSLLRWDISGFVRLEVQRVEIGTAVHRDIDNLAAQLLHKRRVLIFGVYDIESGLSILES